MGQSVAFGLGAHLQGAGATWAQLEVVKLLVDAGANVSVINSDNFTAGDLAACMVIVSLPCIANTSRALASCERSSHIT